jgi:peptide/nickel transport system substrate-binding protein
MMMRSRTSWRGVATVAAVGSTVVALAACGSGTGSGGTTNQKPHRGGTLQVATDADPGSLDPNLNTAYASWYVTELIYGSLLRQDQSGKIVGDVAQSYTHPDARTYTFKLRPGVKFSDGRTATSADVKYSFDRLTDKATASPWSGIFEVIKSIDTPDASTVTFHLKRPFAPFLNYIAYPFYTPILDKQTVEKPGGLKNAAMGTGPFELVSYQPGNQVTLKRNPNYYDKQRPYLDGIRMRVITNDSTRLAAVRSGQVQLAWFHDPRTPKLLGTAANVKVLEAADDRNEEGLAFNQTKAPFNNVDVRRAISEGIDRNAIIKLVLDGKGNIGSKIPGGAKPYGYSGPASGLPYNTYNPADAKKLLAKAGYGGGLTVSLNVAPLYPRDLQTAEIMRDQLGKIGVHVNIVQKDWTTTLGSFVKTSYEGMSMVGLVWQPDPDADAHDLWDSKSPINIGHFKDTQIDRLLEDGRVAQSTAGRAKAYLAAQKRVADMAYMLFPYTSKAEDQVVRDSVQGFTATDSGLHGAALLNTWLTGAR